ncbi:hypothetical protein ACQJ1F_27260, partial [Klebsiella pneumoniae]|uniref:hypothetical protein n=1 Tax=Klebsiella pneumoniae TaxID=573 RepID=UPI003D0409EB
KGRKGKGGRKRIEKGEENRKKGSERDAQGEGGKGGREKVLRHNRVEARAGKCDDTARVGKDAGYRRFPYAD